MLHTTLGDICATAQSSQCSLGCFLSVRGHGREVCVHACKRPASEQNALQCGLAKESVHLCNDEVCVYDSSETLYICMSDTLQAITCNTDAGHVVKEIASNLIGLRSQSALRSQPA